jgi:hypothetical protein
MHKRTVGLILSGALVGGAVGAMVITPASATTSDNVVTSRIAKIKSALSGLIGDGTLTQAQADKVASALDQKLPKNGLGGLGGHVGGMKGLGQSSEAAAKALNMTTDQLRAALKEGKSLADVAKAQKVSVDSLVKAMVAAAQDQLAAAVKAGHLTQAQADAMKSSLTQRITDAVNRVRPDRGQRQPGHGRGHGPGDLPGGSQTTPSTDHTSGGSLEAPSRTV